MLVDLIYTALFPLLSLSVQAYFSVGHNAWILCSRNCGTQNSEWSSEIRIRKQTNRKYMYYNVVSHHLFKKIELDFDDFVSSLAIEMQPYREIWMDIL